MKEELKFRRSELTHKIRTSCNSAELQINIGFVFRICDSRCDGATSRRDAQHVKGR